VSLSRNRTLKSSLMRVSTASGKRRVTTTLSFLPAIARSLHFQTARFFGKVANAGTTDKLCRAAGRTERRKDRAALSLSGPKAPVDIYAAAADPDCADPAGFCDPERPAPPRSPEPGLPCR